MKKKLIGCCSVLGVLAIGYALYSNFFYPVKVSIVMPSYNRADYLPRAIDSVLNQTFQDYELVIVDDGSTDGTNQVLKEYQAKSNKIRVLTHKVNRGVSAARNTGNENARGKYIAVLDSDDFFYPNYLENVVPFMEKNPEVVLLVPKKMNYMEEKGKTFEEFKKWNIFPPLYKIVSDNYIGNVGNIFRRSFIKKHQIKYDLMYSCGEDFNFWFQILYNNGRIEKLDTKEPLLGTRSYGSLSVSYDCKPANAKLLNELYKRVDYKFDPDEWDECELAKKTIEKYPNVFSSKTIEEMFSYCPKETEKYIKINHFGWGIDYFIFEEDEKKVVRKSNKDKATILNFVPNEKITIKWDRWGEETFLFDEKKALYYMPNPDDEKKEEK